jgi:uncharacterized membrane protein
VRTTSIGGLFIVMGLALLVAGLVKNSGSLYITGISLTVAGILVIIMAIIVNCQMKIKDKEVPSK